MKKLAIAAFAVLLISPVGVFAQSYGGGYCDTSGNAIMRFLWPCGTGPGAMQEVMTVHAWGPTSAPSYHTNQGGQYQVSLPQMPQLGTQYQYPSYQQPSYQYQPQYQYQQPQYAYPQHQQPQYQAYPQYPSYQQQYPQYGYQQPYSYPQGGLYQAAIVPPSPTQMAGITPQPVGGHDIWGDPLCNWGSGYYGYSCYQDPHQWIFDSYTGQWY